ncbi:MAG: biotin/lipoyl-binding carrier protein [Betaproteobacteria bacterium]
MARLEAKSDVAGSVWKITTQVGDRLQPGDTVMILESMKMEIPVIAEDGGTVKEFRVAEGEAVVEGQVMAFLEA